MDSSLWTIQKERIKMVDIRPLAGSNQTIFKQNNQRKDSKDYNYQDNIHNNPNNNYVNTNTLQDNINILNNFIVTPIRTLMRKQLMGLQKTGDYFIIYSKTGFQIINQKDYKLIWVCNLSTQNPQRKQVIINLKAYEHFIAVSYYDYILDKTTQFKSIKFKFRIYNILSKTKIIQKSKSTQQPILHIRPINIDKILLVTSSTLYIFNIKAQKILQPFRTRIYSKRFSINSFSYIPQFIDEKSKISRPCYMLLGNSYGGISFHVGKWIQSQTLRQQWFDNVRCIIRNMHLFHYGKQLKALITDNDNNLIVINLKPNTSDKIADINIGTKVNKLKCKHQHDNKIYLSCEDGTIKLLSAIKLDNPEISFIDFIQQSYCKEIPFLGGFNQRQSRLLNQKYRTYKYTKQGNIINTDLIQEFFSLTKDLKDQLCQKSQIKIEQLKAIIRSI